MKKTSTMITMTAVLLLTYTGMYAQDSTRPGVIKQVTSGNEKADNLLGKKIQQQTLSNKTFEKSDTIAATPVKKKKHIKKKNRY